MWCWSWGGCDALCAKLESKTIPGPVSCAVSFRHSCATQWRFRLVMKEKRSLSMMELLGCLFWSLILAWRAGVLHSAHPFAAETGLAAFILRSSLHNKCRGTASKVRSALDSTSSLLHMVIISRNVLINHGFRRMLIVQR